LSIFAQARVDKPSEPFSFALGSEAPTRMPPISWEDFHVWGVDHVYIFAIEK
jgi:hypothetical protein